MTVKCPECGIKYENRRKIIHHFTNDRVHPRIRDYFKVKLDNGETYYRNPALGEYFFSYVEFRNSWYQTEYSMSEYFLENFGKLPDEDELWEKGLGTENKRN